MAGRTGSSTAAQLHGKAASVKRQFIPQTHSARCRNAVLGAYTLLSDTSGMSLLAPQGPPLPHVAFSPRFLGQRDTSQGAGHCRRSTRLASRGDGAGLIDKVTYAGRDGSGQGCGEGQMASQVPAYEVRARERWWGCWVTRRLGGVRGRRGCQRQSNVLMSAAMRRYLGLRTTSRVLLAFQVDADGCDRSTAFAQWAEEGGDDSDRSSNDGKGRDAVPS